MTRQIYIFILSLCFLACSGQRLDTLKINLKTNSNPLSENTWKDAYYRFYYKKRLLGEFQIKNNKPEGIWKSYSENGVLTSETEWHTSDGITTYRGIYKEYHQNGKLKIEGKYGSCLEDSIPCISCYEYDTVVGKERSVSWAKYDSRYTLRTGIWKEYYSNGIIKSEGEYSPSVAFDHKGFSKKEPKINNLWLVHYTKGEYPYKEWKYYDENGKLTKIVIYDIFGISTKTIDY